MKYNAAIDNITSMFVEQGLNQMSLSYQRDFEVYMCALELTDFDGNTIDYFSFPIMPNQINKSESESTTVQHSLNGTIILNKDGFTPNDISISGNFGRTFKVAFEDKSSAEFKAFSIGSGVYSFSDLFGVTNKVKELPFGIKTGYGCIKILQSIIDKAKGYDSRGRNFRLLFYNSALGESYLVIPTKTPLEFNQNESNSNMLWNYTLNLTILADLKDVVFSANNEKSLNNILKPNFVKSTSNLIVNNLLKYGL